VSLRLCGENRFGMIAIEPMTQFSG
jgi:hypothetical protein